MAATNRLKENPKVSDAVLIMGTEVNKELLAQGGLLTPEAQQACANDLIICVKCASGAAALLDEAEALLSNRTASFRQSSELPPSIRSALRNHPDLNLVLISLGGSYASREAREALAAGMHVLLFSDNVALEDEIALKRYAVSHGLLLMGPGAGTALINGVGLGFANAVEKGEIGIVSAAGTGLQEVSTLISKNGAGVSQGIGTGGRDLSQPVGGLTFFQGLQALLADENTRVLVLISKPPDAQVTQQLLQTLGDPPKPVVLCLLGAKLPESSARNLHFARTLEECALTAVGLWKGSAVNMSAVLQEEEQHWQPVVEELRAKLDGCQRFLRALFSGGTLCYEAQSIWKELLSSPVYSNAPLSKENKLPDSNRSQGHSAHSAIDLGEEEFTRGRPHPMIDNSLRIQRLRQEAFDPHTAVIVLDVVLGYGAHADPAGELGTAIEQISSELRQNERTVVFIASVTGTQADPQNLQQSTQKLADSGVLVCSSNAQAARLAARFVEGRR